MTTMRRDAADELKSYLERVERIAAERKEMGDEIGAIYAEAKARGFDTSVMKYMVRRRAKDPAKLAEAEAIADTYMHAVGMTAENPLYSAVSRMAVDTLARDQVIETLQLLIPTNGEIIARVGGAPMRLWRDETGKAHAAEYVEPVATPSSSTARPAEKTGKALKTSAAVLSMVPKDPVKAAADAAEKRARKKRGEDEPNPSPSGVDQDESEPVE